MEGLAAVSLKHLPRYLKAIWVYRVSWHALILKLDEPNFTPVGIIKLSILFKTETWSHPLLASFLYVKHSKLKYNFFIKLNIFLYFCCPQKQAARLLSKKAYCAFFKIKNLLKKGYWVALFESMAAKQAKVSKRAMRACSLNVSQLPTVLFFSILSKKSNLTLLGSRTQRVLFMCCFLALKKIINNLEENKNPLRPFLWIERTEILETNIQKYKGSGFFELKASNIKFVYQPAKTYILFTVLTFNIKYFF